MNSRDANSSLAHVKNQLNLLAKPSPNPLPEGEGSPDHGLDESSMLLPLGEGLRATKFLSCSDSFLRHFGKASF
jgi:hypothetical protein